MPKTGGRLLTDLGWPEVGDIVRQHVHLDANGHPGPPTEVEIVNYADKRVMHDSIVSLEQRMDYILQRYGTTPMPPSSDSKALAADHHAGAEAVRRPAVRTGGSRVPLINAAGRFYLSVVAGTRRP